MEGNFYVGKTLERPLRSKLGNAYSQCTFEGRMYATCIEKAHYNEAIVLDGCDTERMAMMKCIEAQTSPAKAAKVMADIDKDVKKKKNM